MNGSGKSIMDGMNPFGNGGSYGASTANGIVKEPGMPGHGATLLIRPPYFRVF